MQLNLIRFTSQVEAYLKEQLLDDENESSTIDSDDTDNPNSEEETITFKQWTSVDRSDLITQTLSVTEYISILCNKLNLITTHSYIAKLQASYLRELRKFK